MPTLPVKSKIDGIYTANVRRGVLRCSPRWAFNEEFPEKSLVNFDLEQILAHTDATAMSSKVSTDSWVQRSRHDAEHGVVSRVTTSTQLAEPL